MPKKKQPRNAFYFFMLDFKARAERNGERFPNGLRDVQNEASPEWEVMPAERKKKYEDMAKEEKGRLKNDSSGKQTCWLNSFSSIDKQRERLEEEKNSMIHYVKTRIQMLTNRRFLSESKFYLVHVNYFCISEGECYHPAELALCEFSLGEGITNVYHSIIDPGQVPLGYRHDAQSKSESTHKIPVDNNGGERYFYKILSDINTFLEPGRLSHGGDYPPMFTLPDNVNLNTSMSAVKSVIETLCVSDPRAEDAEKYRVYPLEYLFLELQNACVSVSEMGDEVEEDEEGNASRQHTKLPNISMALMELEKDVYNYTVNIACEFHCKEDVVEYCSKSYVQRWVYLICDYCCQYLNITMLAGRHMPENADVDFRRNFKKAREEEEKAATARLHHSKPQPAPLKPWVPISNPPLPRPTVKANLAAMLPRDPPPFDSSEDSFPSICIGRGRGRLLPRGGARGGGAPFSFADAMKNKK